MDIAEEAGSPSPLLEAVATSYERGGTGCCQFLLLLHWFIVEGSDGRSYFGYGAGPGPESASAACFRHRLKFHFSSWGLACRQLPETLRSRTTPLASIFRQDP